MLSNRHVWVAATLLGCSLVLPAQPRTAMLLPSKDNTLYENATGAISYGAGEQILAGRTGQGSIRRCLLAFDLAGSLPASSTITSAQLQLHVEMTTSGAVDISAHRVTRDWGEGSSTSASNPGQGAPSTTNDATWIHAFWPSTNWTLPGGDFVAIASATTSVNASSVSYLWSSPQLLADVQGWLATPASNFGWLMKANEASFPSAKSFGSRQNAGAFLAPHLIVTYTTTSAPAVVRSGIGGLTLPAVTRFNLAVTPPPAIGTTVTVAVSGGPFTSPALSFIYLAPAIGSGPFALPGAQGALYLEVTSALLYISLGLSPIGPLPLDGTGSITFPFPVPNSMMLVGTSIDAQVLAVDVTGAYLSNALTLIFG